MNKDIYEHKREQFLEKLENWKNNYVKLKSAILSYESTPLTLVMLTELQCLVDDYVKCNDIHIKLYVNQIDQKIIIMGRTLEDELIWETIQRI